MRLAYRVPEVASLLGVSPDTIRREIACRRLSASKLRGAVVVRAADLERYVRSFPEAVAPVAPARLRVSRASQTVSLERARALRETARG